MDLPPHLHVAEAQPLHEMIEEIEQAEGKKEVFHLLAPQVLKAADVCVHIFMNILYGNILPMSRFRSERSPGGTCQGTGHVPVIVWSAAEGGKLVDLLT